MVSPAAVLFVAGFSLSTTFTDGVGVQAGAGVLMTVFAQAASSFLISSSKSLSLIFRRFILAFSSKKLIKSLISSCVIQTPLKVKLALYHKFAIISQNFDLRTK